MIPDVKLALSIRQPWAWLIINGYKDIENRSWPTNYRGTFFIHASKTFDNTGYKIVKERYKNNNPRAERF